MARLACVVAAAAVAVATAFPADAATSLQDASSRAFFNPPHVVWKKPVAVPNPAHGKGVAGHGALPVVVLPAESELPVVVLPAEPELPVVVLTATPSAAARTPPPKVAVPSASAAPVPTVSATPTAKPVQKPVGTAPPRPTACVPAMRNGVMCPCENGRLKCRVAPRPTACIPAVRNGVTCPCKDGRLNCAAATAAPTAAAGLVDVNTVDVFFKDAGRDDKPSIATAKPRPTACIPAVRDGVTCPCKDGRLNCAAATAAPSAAPSPRPTACIPAVRNGVTCPCKDGRLNCAAATAVPTASPSVAPTVAPTAAPTAVVVVTAAPVASATPASTVVVVAPSTQLCKACDPGRVVVKAVPCVKTQKKLVYGCGSAHTFFSGTTVAPTATAAPDVKCARWIDVAVQTTCLQRKLVKVCRQVPCPVKKW